MTIYVYIWKKIIDSNPTICEEKLTTNNPNRKGDYRETKSVDTIAFGSAEPSSVLWGVILVMLSVDGCIISVKIYKNLEKL